MSTKDKLTLQQINAKITILCDNTRNLRMQIETNEAEKLELVALQTEILNNKQEK